MTTMIISLPAVVKDDVIPVLRPTVPSADAVSNIMSSNANPFCFSVTLKSRAAAINITAKSSVTVIARATMAGFIVRLKISTFFLL